MKKIRGIRKAGQNCWKNEDGSFTVVYKDLNPDFKGANNEYYTSKYQRLWYLDNGKWKATKIEEILWTPTGYGDTKGLFSHWER